MKGEEKIEDWLKIARRDFERVKRNLKAEDIEAAGFCLQQCVEKYLKAFLIQHGWKLKKIHMLDALLKEAIKFKPTLASFKELCAKISPYYLAERYPPFGSLDATAEDIKKDLEETKKLIRLLFPQEELK